MTRNDLHKYVRDYAVPIHTTVHIEATVDTALKEIRKRNVDERIIYFYVLDDQHRLQGVVPTRKLLLSEPEVKISEIMDHSVICLLGHQTLQEALEFLESHRLLALPVVDDERRFLGVIDVDLYLEESLDVANSKRRRDIFQMIGMYVEEGRRLKLWRSYSNRMPWIFCNMFGGLACAAISRAYELVLSQVIVLAMFIPLLLTLSESISMQSLTQSMQLMKRQTHSFKHTMQSLFREWKVVALISLTSGLIVGFISLLWDRGIASGLTITLSIFISVILSAGVGSVLPLILHSKNWDPKVAAGPVTLMFADVLTTAIYLTLGTMILLHT